MKNDKLNIAVIGATGNVGRKVVGMLLERELAYPNNLKLYASPRSAGQTLTIDNRNFLIHNTEQTDFANIDICIFNTEGNISEKFVPKALNAGAYVIDSSSYYRLHPEVPLIVPPVNKMLINSRQKIYAHANCLASPIATVIGPLHKYHKIHRVNAVTYQSTSGAGKVAADECWAETCSIVQKMPYERKHFKRQIALNVIPQVGAIRDDSLTSEEYKIIYEIKKIIDQNIAITATAVRVPVLIGHSIALSIEFERTFVVQDIIRILQHAPSVQLSNNDYATPVEVVDSDDVFVGRVRRDTSVESGLHLWLCSDNLRRGAATDAVEITEALLMSIIRYGKE
ncbi:Aspartate-semialdehyde dehydrogenase [Alphaproteobacteria bacterium]